MATTKDTTYSGTTINDRLPIRWHGKVHVHYLTTHRAQRTRGYENRADAIQFCQTIDRIDRALETAVNREWELVACRCDRKRLAAELINSWQLEAAEEKRP